MKRYLSVEADPLGPYQATITVRDLDGSHEPVDVKVSADDLESLMHNLHLALARLRRRQTTDAVCGDCERCQNARLVRIHREGYHHPELVHCPVCRPKIVAATSKGIL